MDNGILETNIKKLVSLKNCFFLFSCILSLAVVLLTILLFSKRERVVIVPTVGSSYWIEEGNVSSSYIEKMGLFLSDLLLNRTPSDVEKKNQIILEYVHPSFYHEIKKSLFLQCLVCCKKKI